MAKKIKKGAPAWMTTFADMATLLLTFFVILLSMSTTDVIKFQALLGSIREAMGVQFEDLGEFQPIVQDEIIPSKEPGEGEWQEVQPDALGQDIGYAEELEKQQMEQAVSEIDDAISQTEMADLAVVTSGPHGIRVRVKGALLFDPGAASLRAQAMPLLDSMVEVMHKFNYYLLVEGHTDSIPISTAQFPSNWELSAFRASAVLRYIQELGIDPKRLSSIGLADNYPIEANDTPEGRAANRRVEFVLTKHPFRPEIGESA